MQTGRTETITATDGGTFEALVTVPTGEHRSGVLLIPEIFGLNDYIADVARRLAQLGHVVLTPDLFWRQQPGVSFDSSDQNNMAPAMEIANAWDVDLGLADLGVALDHLRTLPEVSGAVGVVGFCFGGTQAFRVAEAFDPSCAVCYYGSGIPDHLDQLHTIECPTLLHFGDEDPFIPNETVAAVENAVADNHHVLVDIHPEAGHAFDNHLAPHFSNPKAAATAWTQTGTFLFTHLGGPHMGA
jgi:carboxymethylenebutenolidase